MIATIEPEVKNTGLSLDLTDSEVYDLFSELDSLNWNDKNKTQINRLYRKLKWGKDYRQKLIDDIEKEKQRVVREAELVYLREKVERRKLLRYLKRKKEMKKKREK